MQSFLRKQLAVVLHENNKSKLTIFIRGTKMQPQRTSLLLYPYTPKTIPPLSNLINDISTNK